MDFFNTFRGRLLVILLVLLIATLGVQFYLNLRTQNENEQLRELQEQTIVAGIALGVSGITSSEYMQAMDRTDNNITKSAKLLGLTFRTLQYRLEKFGIKKDENEVPSEE